MPRTIDTLIFTLLVDVVEVPQHLDGADVGARVVDNALTAVLHEVLKQLKSLGARREQCFIGSCWD